MHTVEARDFLKRPYKRVLIPDEESGTFTGLIVEFPGCFAQGANPAEAYERLEVAAESWIEAALEMQQEIPLPTADIQFSGRFVLRLPRSLHRQAAQLAELEGTSLNQFVVATLAEAVGFAKARDYTDKKVSELSTALAMAPPRPSVMQLPPFSGSRVDLKPLPQDKFLRLAGQRGGAH